MRRIARAVCFPGRSTIVAQSFVSRQLVAAVFLASAIACDEGSDRQDTTAVGRTAAGASTRDSVAREVPDGFALLRDGDTLALERFGRSGDTLRGEILDVANGNRMTYKAAVEADERVTWLQFALHGPGSDSAAGVGTVRVHGDSIVAERQEAGSSVTQRIAAPKGTSLYLNPSMALMEQVLRRAKALGGQRPQLPVFTISTQADARVDRPTVTWVGTDSAEIARSRDNRVRVAIGENSRILGGFNADQVQIRRLP